MKEDINSQDHFIMFIEYYWVANTILSLNGSMSVSELDHSTEDEDMNISFFDLSKSFFLTRSGK